VANKAVSLDDLCLHHDDVAQAECSAEAAVKLLELAAGYLERREVMPKILADFIATAFRTTAKVEHEHRPAWLAASLKLTAPNRRPKYTDTTLSLVMRNYALYAATFDWSETKTIEELAAAGGVGTTQARTWWKEWKKKNPNALAAAEFHAASWKAENEEKLT